MDENQNRSQEMHMKHQPGMAVDGTKEELKENKPCRHQGQTAHLCGYRDHRGGPVRPRHDGDAAHPGKKNLSQPPITNTSNPSTPDQYAHPPPYTLSAN